MFRFMFRRRPTEDAVPETMRQQAERALDEVNAIIGQLDPKPAVTYDPHTGALSIALPDTLPDEALALPAPDDIETTETSEAADAKAQEAVETVEEKIEAEKEPA